MISWIVGKAHTKPNQKRGKKGTKNSCKRKRKINKHTTISSKHTLYLNTSNNIQRFELNFRPNSAIRFFLLLLFFETFSVVDLQTHQTWNLHWISFFKKKSKKEHFQKNRSKKSSSSNNRKKNRSKKLEINKKNDQYQVRKFDEKKKVKINLHKYKKQRAIRNRKPNTETTAKGKIQKEKRH